MVDRNLLKLQVRRLRENLYSRADEVFSLEKRKLELSTAMSERSKEIEVFKDMLNAQIHASSSDKQKVDCTSYGNGGQPPFLDSLGVLEFRKFRFLSSYKDFFGGKGKIILQVWTIHFIALRNAEF